MTSRRRLKETVTEGVRALKAGGADVVLVDLQYAPIGLSASHHGVMQAIIADVARQERVGLFSRFALMRRSVEAGLPAGALELSVGPKNPPAVHLLLIPAFFHQAVSC
jgi:hypothetical protein